MKRTLVVYGVLAAAFFSFAGCSGSWKPDTGGALEVRCAVITTGQNMMGWPVLRLICRPEKDMPDTRQENAPKPGQTGA